MRSLAALLMLLPTVALAHPKYLVRVRDVEEAAGVKSDFTEQAKQLFVEELKKHPEFELDWPADLPKDPDQLVGALKQKHLRAFEVTLKILDVKRGVEPPPPGKQYRVLTRGIKLSVFGDTLPEKVVAIGGDGEASVAAEIGKAADVDKEGRSLLSDATKVAVAQAVDMTVTKLNLADKPVHAKAKPKKK